MRNLDRTIALTLASVETEHTRRMYRRHLERFAAWYADQGCRKLDRATVLRYLETLDGAALPQSLSALKKLAQIAAKTGTLDHENAEIIQSIKTPKKRPAKSQGNAPLTHSQTRRLLNAPDIAEVSGLRDRAILALLIGTGMRRVEVAELKITQIQRNKITVTRDHKTQTVLLPEWVKFALDAYRKKAKIKDGPMFRSVKRGDGTRGLSPDGVYLIVAEYADKLGLEITPNSLRHTFAQLAYEAGADLDEIAAALGHSSTKATREMLGLSGEQTQRSKTAPGERIALM